MRYDQGPICSRCVLPASPPEITLDDAGVCSVCRAHEREARERVEPFLETDFTKILAQHRGKHEFDCLVMCSGGKDSTASLYYMTRRYKARVLAFMFDHGFETPEAVENVHRAVAKLGVELVSYRSTFMHDAFARMLKEDTRAVICHLCSMWYMALTYRMAARFDTPLIIAGWTKGQSQQGGANRVVGSAAAPEYAAMARATREFIEGTLHRDPKYADFPTSMEEVTARARKRHKAQVLSPHWFLPYQAEEYVEVIQRELGWRYPQQSYPAQSTNCALNYLSVHNSMRCFGFTHYHIEMSKLIREGHLSRAEALARLEPSFDAPFLSALAQPFGVSYAPDGRPVVNAPAK